MYHPNSPKAMAIGAGKHLKATGIIKKVFLNKPDPYGFVLLLTPLELRGQEASFFCGNLDVPADERENLRVGMQLEFDVIDKPVDNMKSSVDYKAVNLLPLTPSYYNAVVILAPGERNSILRVAVDLTLEQVKITSASYASLKLDKHLKVGDPCVIQLTWKEMVTATKEKRTLEGEIVYACRLPIPAGFLQEETETGSEETVPSNEDSPPEKPEQGRRGPRTTPKKVRVPLVRSKPPMPTTPKLISSYETNHYCDDFKKDPRCRSASCCQDHGFLAPKIPSFPLPALNAPCACAGCMIMRQKYAMTTLPGCLSCYPMDFGTPSWTNVDNC